LTIFISFFFIAVLISYEKVNCILDVVDARLPMTGKNAHFSAGSRAPRVVLFTKDDLTDLTAAERQYFTQREIKDGGADAVVWGRTDSHVSPAITDEVIAAIVKATRRWRSNESAIEVIVTGIPNTGKSSLINNLHRCHMQGAPRKRALCTAGDLPAVTRKVSERIMVCAEPKIYVQDTPGIFPMTKLAQINQLRLAAANLFPINQIPHGYVQGASFFI
jgi:ribosome biogenesis GTPase A